MMGPASTKIMSLTRVQISDSFFFFSNFKFIQISQVYKHVNNKRVKTSYTKVFDGGSTFTKGIINIILIIYTYSYVYLYLICHYLWETDYVCMDV